MGSKHSFSNPAFQQKNNSNTNFNLVPKTTNFNSIFAVKPLLESEASHIENLLVSGANPESHNENQVHTDITMLKSLTAEIKAIGKQGILLMGERVAKAREMLRSYHNGTFTKWLDATFGSKKTGYNLLTYFDFYSALPEPELKEKFQKFPQKVAYILASRQGDMKKKEAIVRGYDESKRIDLISIIHEKLPIKVDDKRGRKDMSLGYIHKLKNELSAMIMWKVGLTDESKEALEDLRTVIDSILEVTPIKKSKK